MEFKYKIGDIILYKNSQIKWVISSININAVGSYYGIYRVLDDGTVIDDVSNPYIQYGRLEEMTIFDRDSRLIDLLK